MQEKNSSGGAWRRGMARGGVELTLAVDKWEMEWGGVSLGWVGWGAEHACGIFSPFPLLFFPARKK